MRAHSLSRLSSRGASRSLLFCFVSIFGPAVAPLTASAAGSFQLQEATIDDIQSAIKSGEVTCKGVVEMYLARAKAYNGVCTKLVTSDGQSIPAAFGPVRGGGPLKFPTQTVGAASILPDFKQY